MVIGPASGPLVGIGEQTAGSSLVLEDVHGSLLDLLNRLFWLGLLGSYMPRAAPAPGSGGRPWRPRLLRLTLSDIRANQELGVRYFPIRALTSPSLQGRAFGTAQEVLITLFSSGMVLAAPPPPAWALAVLGRGPRPEIAWLPPVPPVPYRRREPGGPSAHTP